MDKKKHGDGLGVVWLCLKKEERTRGDEASEAGRKEEGEGRKSIVYDMVADVTDGQEFCTRDHVETSVCLTV